MTGWRRCTTISSGGSRQKIHKRRHQTPTTLLASNRERRSAVSGDRRRRRRRRRQHQDLTTGGRHYLGTAESIHLQQNHGGISQRPSPSITQRLHPPIPLHDITPLGCLPLLSLPGLRSTKHCQSQQSQVCIGSYPTYGYTTHLFSDTYSI